ncbi:MAG: hypothetical protein WA610_14365 [Thermodesulfovibrionales bacterium]
MRKLYAIPMMAVLLCIFFSARVDALTGPNSAGWVPLKEDIHIRKTSIAYPADNTVSLWIRIEPATETDLLRSAHTLLMEKGRDDLALAYYYTVYLSEIDCGKRRHRELIAILYDTNHNIIHSVQPGQAPWDAIGTGDSFDVVRNSVCAAD